MTQEDVTNSSREERLHLEQELNDVLIYLVALAH